MLEPETLLFLLRQSLKIIQRTVQQIGSAADIGIDKLQRGINGTVNVGFRRQMHDRIRCERFKNLPDDPAVANIAAHKTVTR